MSTRGINFLDQWIANNIPETTKGDVISVDELTHKLIADAMALGVKRQEIDEEVEQSLPDNPRCHSALRCWHAGMTSKGRRADLRIDSLNLNLSIP